MSNFTSRFKKQQGLPKVSENEKKLRNALGTAAQVLMQYAKGSNWADMDGKCIWLGEGQGPDLAEKALGIKKDTTPDWKPKGADHA
jgi:hypothetical protein